MSQKLLVCLFDFKPFFLLKKNKKSWIGFCLMKTPAMSVKVFILLLIVKYFADRKADYPVKVHGITISPDPVVRGEEATFKVSASTSNTLRLLSASISFISQFYMLNLLPCCEGFGLAI